MANRLTTAAAVTAPGEPLLLGWLPAEPLLAGRSTAVSLLFVEAFSDSTGAALMHSSGSPLDAPGRPPFSTQLHPMQPQRADQPFAKRRCGVRHRLVDRALVAPRPVAPPVPGRGLPGGLRLSASCRSCLQLRLGRSVLDALQPQSPARPAAHPWSNLATPRPAGPRQEAGARSGPVFFASTRFRSVRHP